MKEREVLKQAREALKIYQKASKFLDVCNPAIRAIDNVLDPCIDGSCDCCWKHLDETEQENKAFNDGVLEGVLRERAYWLKAQPEQEHDDSAVHFAHCNIGENTGYCKYGEDDCPVIAKLKAQPKEPDQEPVAYTGNGTAGREADVKPTGFFFQMPPQRTWVGLTLKEILDTYRGPDGSDYVEYARGLEAKLKEKNT